MGEMIISILTALHDFKLLEKHNVCLLSWKCDKAYKSKRELADILDHQEPKP